MSKAANLVRPVGTLTVFSTIQTMELFEIIGILVFKCNKCGSKYVTNTEAIKEGIALRCQCGYLFHVPRWSKLNVNLEIYHQSTNKYACKETIKEYNKPLNNNEPMPITEYKAMLAKIILEGKKPKVPAKHKKVVSFNTNQQAIIDSVDALVAFGCKRQEAIAQVDIAVSEGFYTEEEIIKKVLSTI